MNVDCYHSPDAQHLLRVRAERLSRVKRRPELLAELISAALFLVVAALLPVLAHWHRPLHLVNVALVLSVWVMVERVKFPAADAWAYPTLLAFVPALFILPVSVVPLVAMVAALLRAAPHFARGKCSLAMVPTFIADAWFTIGPALVLIAAGHSLFSWSRWPIYALAFLSEVLFDSARSISRAWFVDRIKPSVEIPLLIWIYLVDAALAPLGLLIAAAAAERPALLLIALSPLAMLIAFARERRERLDQSLALSSAYRGTALLLADVVEADDAYTAAHSRNVVDLALSVADALGLDGEQRRNVEFAAMLHDIGKIRVPKEIIHKPSGLDDEEWALMRQHTIFGESMLQRVGGILSSIGGFVRHSHERYDGFGYPDGLQGEEIPIESRVVSACDAFSAMTTDRPYRLALPVEDAIAELRRCSGTQFDALVVRELVRVVRHTHLARELELVAV